MSGRRHRSFREKSPPPFRPANGCRALLVIDNQPLQAAAWAALRRARKQLEKAAGDLHRHEEIDEPAFRAWISNTFATLVSAVRELAQQVEAKGHLIDAVQRESFFTGHSPGRIWREWQKSGGRPPEQPIAQADASDGRPPDKAAANAEADFEEEMKRLFGEEGIDDDDPFTGAFRDAAQGAFGLGGARAKSAEADAKDARTIYRRLVQHLHPDRGGGWTPARARAWEQTQAAWAARDADWLSRLEAEWEAGTDLLGPTSVIGRLRAAVAAIDAARRDTERRLRIYRKQESWRFSLRPPSPALEQLIERQLRTDETMLRRDLAAMESTLVHWSTVRTRRRRAPSRSNRI